MSDLTSVPGAHNGPFSQIVESPGQGEARPPLGARPSVHSEPHGRSRPDGYPPPSRRKRAMTAPSGRPVVKPIAPLLVSTDGCDR